jgi:Phage capsid family
VPIINRGAGVGASLIPEDYARGIIKNVTQMSAAMRLLARRRMTRQTQRMSVMTSKPTAAFVTAGTAPFDSTDVGLKAVTRMTWADLTMYAEPVAAIVIIPDHFYEDQSYDLWGEVRSEIEEAIAAAIDSAVFFGTNKPASWPASIVQHATAAGNTVTAPTGVDLAADLNSAMGKVEEDGFYPSGWFYDLREKATLRGLRDGNRQFLYAMRGPANTGLQNAGDDDEISARVRDVRANGEIWNLPAYTSAMGLVGFTPGAGATRYVTGDFDKAILGVRSDIRVKMLTEATLTDGADTWQLAQRDATAMRIVTRVAYVTSNPPTRLAPAASDAVRSPFAIVKTA